MGCLWFSSDKPPEGDNSKLRLSWSIFRGFSSPARTRRSPPSAPSSCPSQTNAEKKHEPRFYSSSETHKRQSYFALPPKPSQADNKGVCAIDARPSQEIAQPLIVSSGQNASEPLAFSYAELRVACRGFSHSNLLGEGGFGCVYRGFINSRDPNKAHCRQEVAVKLLNRNGQQGDKEWLAEVRFLGLVEHPNLVKLVGFCAEDNERGIQRLLVYEFVARGSVEDYLFSKTQTVLSWQQRLQIMLGAARGLAYLHRGVKDVEIIYRDFKTSNILLEEDFNPKLSDFGLARQGPEVGATHVSTSVVGTIGYAAPEYVQTGHLTSKSDVWSFGIVLFEILTGRRAVDQNRPKSEQHLLEWVRPHLRESKRIVSIMDPRLEGDYSMVQVQKIVELALHCCDRAPRARPTMNSVVKKLQQTLENINTRIENDVTSKRIPLRTEQRREAGRNSVIEEVRGRSWAPKPLPLKQSIAQTA